MNKQNILAVADAIEQATLRDQNLGFNMAVFYDDSNGLEDHTGHNCGIVACIAGWAAAMFERDGTPRARPIIQPASMGRAFRETPRHAREALGLHLEIADALFQPQIDDSYKFITAEEAVATLRRLAETGEVVWNVANVDEE